MASEFQLLDEAIALLKRSRGARSRQLAHQLVRGAVRGVIRESGQVGAHHVRVLSRDLESAWTAYESSRDGRTRDALGRLNAVKSSLDSLRVAQGAGGVESIRVVVKGCVGEQLYAQDVPVDRIPKKARGAGATERISPDGSTVIARRPKSKVWVVQFPKLLPWQEEVYRDTAPNIAVTVGRQSGKTTLGVCRTLADAFLGRDAYWIAPSFRHADNAWGILERLVAALGDRIPGIKTWGRPYLKVVVPAGGTWQLQSSDDPNSLRGGTGDVLWLDEFAFGRPDVLEVVQPIVAVRQGRMLFASTPNGRNHHFDVHEAAEASGWSRYHLTALEAGLIDPEAIERARDLMTPAAFAAEYEASFETSGAQLFHREHLQHYRTEVVGDETVHLLGDESVPARTCRVFATADLAVSTKTSADFSVVATWAATPKGHLLLIDAIRDRLEADGVIAALRLAHAKHGGTIYVERATQSLAIVSMAKRESLPIDDVKAEKDKLSRAQAAAHLMATGRMWFPRPQAAPWVTDLLDELFSFPSGRHDDFVDCLSYASLQASERKPRIHAYQGPSERGDRVAVPG